MSDPALQVRAVIVDDEPLARQTLRLLAAEDAELEVIAECSSGAEAVAAIRRLEPDLVFLDVQMPEVDGFGVLREVGLDRLPLIIFVTAYEAHALRAFDAHAVDFLLKPFEDERFHQAVGRAKHAIRTRKVGELTARLLALLQADSSPGGGATGGPAAEYVSRLAVRTGGRVTFVNTADIDWIEAADYNVRLHVGGRHFLLRQPLRDLERRLDPRHFARVHRSAIVNLNRVRELEPYFHGEYIIRLDNGTKLKLSRTRRDQLRRFFGDDL
jgi:two-component system LytT family response regulator